MPVEAMRYVPHAEYKALHQDRDTWIHSFQAEQAQSARLAAELDTLRRKVRALLAADDELDAANTMFESVPTDGTGKAIIVAMRQRRSAMMELR
jgi:hypothetical protein